MFSLNLTFDTTLMMQFCYFFCKNLHFLGYKFKTQLLHSAAMQHVGDTVSVSFIAQKVFIFAQK